MEIIHKKYGELNRRERSELFDFRLYNCCLTAGDALREPEPGHGFVGIWDRKKLVAVGIYRPLAGGKAIPADAPKDAKKYGIRSLDVDSAHRGRGYGSKLLAELVKGIAGEAGGPALVRMEAQPELAEAMKRLGFKRDKLFHYTLLGAE